MAADRRVVQGTPPPPLVVYVRSMFQQQGHHLDVAVHAGVQERRVTGPARAQEGVAVYVAGIHAGPVCQALAGRLDVPGLHRVDEAVVPPDFFVDPGIVVGPGDGFEGRLGPGSVRARGRWRVAAADDETEEQSEALGERSRGHESASVLPASSWTSYSSVSHH